MNRKQHYIRDGRRFVKVDTPTPQQAVNRVGMYLRNDGTFTAERDAKSIGLCVISINGIHSVLLLKDCHGTFTNKEAIEMAQMQSSTDFTMEVPTTVEMIAGFECFHKELNLPSYRTYRAVTYAVLRSATVYFTPSNGGTLSGSGWENYRYPLRLCIRVKE